MGNALAQKKVLPIALQMIIILEQLKMTEALSKLLALMQLLKNKAFI
jgi:hypothetical protein